VAVRHIRRKCREAIARRLNGEEEVAVFLSGGIDSSGVTHWLTEQRVRVRAFSLDFGEHSVEKGQAETVASQLKVPLQFVPVDGAAIGAILPDLVWKLDLPFGDPVTGPQYLLARAAHACGLSSVFNGEGGDQLFGGWTTKPMVSAQLYAGLYEDDTREEQYLRSYHRFYGLEDQLYTAQFQDQVGPPGQRRAHLIPYLHSDQAATFLNRVRLADISLKGSQNILPRAERVANGETLDVRVPLFDRALAEASFRLPPQLKLHGACEKYILKLILQRHLPREIVWRRKFGMSVPVTEWTLGPLAPLMQRLLGPAAVSRRGLFQSAFIERMRQGQNEPREIRRRRIGERLWALAMLEAWMRVFIDGRGRKPSGSL
jgi:asparagine synthase (glutamine-hydrolysing)